LNYWNSNGRWGLRQGLPLNFGEIYSEKNPVSHAGPDINTGLPRNKTTVEDYGVFYLWIDCSPRSWGGWIMGKFRYHTRLLADLLTVCRVVLSLLIILLGIQSELETLPQVVLVLIIAWLTDLFDGPLARQDTHHPVTIIGEHDAEADLTTSIGVTVYLALAGYIPAAGALIFLLILTRVWFWHSHQLAWPLYALPYALLLVLAFQEAPAYGRLMGAYVLTMLVISWPRLNDEFLPEFFEALESIRRPKH
jgi:hypothetical protein